MAGLGILNKMSGMVPTHRSFMAAIRRRKTHVAWSVVLLSLLGFLLPATQPARTGSGQPSVLAGVLIAVFTVGVLFAVVLPWIPTRFSLSALLVLMTVIALLLGAASFVAQN